MLPRKRMVAKADQLLRLLSIPRSPREIMNQNRDICAKAFRGDCQRVSQQTDNANNEDNRTLLLLFLNIIYLVLSATLKPCIAACLFPASPPSQSELAEEV